MEYRLLGRSGLKISALTLGTMTFGGEGFFAKAGNSSIKEAQRIIDISRDAVIDLYQVHEWDGLTPLEETLEALDTLLKAGKIRYVGCSNYSGWHIMKALAIADRDHRTRFVSQQVYYSLQARDAEY